MHVHPTRFFVKDLATPEAEATAISVTPLGGGQYLVKLGDEEFQVDALATPGGAASLLINGQSYAPEFEEKGDEVQVSLRGQKNRFDVVDERRARLRAASASAEAHGKQTLSAPMPGKVVKIFVKAGDAVAEGQPLVVVEAMKMENELKSPKAGVVVDVFAKEGVAVENGAPLVSVE
jgi:biotin carboxyl carrier protein